MAGSLAAASRIAAVRRDLPPGALALAAHAAVPAAVDADFMHLLRINFFLDPPWALPYDAEADLLLSPLFRELGEGLYETDPGVREVLLISLTSQFGIDRLRKVALLLEQYADRAAAWAERPELEYAQRLTALSILDPQQVHSWLADYNVDQLDHMAPGRYWFVAMQERITAAPSQNLTIRDAIDIAVARLDNTDAATRADAVARLGELAFLPGADLHRIVQVLRSIPASSAAGRTASALLLRLDPGTPSASSTEERRPPRGSAKNEFGRVDQDGTVYVTTAEGERIVGSWQAGTPQEGLAHFAQRFADIVTEVDLIEARLTSGAAEPGQSVSSLRRIRASLPEAHVVGDVDGLGSRLDELVRVAEEKVADARVGREVARRAALASKTALVEEAEQIGATSTQWKAAGDRLREILDEWKTIKGIDKKTDGELWKRYSAARDAFTRRRGTHFANLDQQRKQAVGIKEELVAEAESLATSTEWNPAANRLKELMAEWKTAPRAAKDVEQKLWERFRAAQDKFFAHRSEVLSVRDAEQKATVDKRQALLAEAEAIDVDADPRAAQAKLREIQGQWHDSGRVSREVATGLDRRLKAVDDKVRAAMESAWRGASPDSNPLLVQMREQVAEAEARLARAEAAGDAKRVKEAQRALATKRRFLELVERS